MLPLKVLLTIVLTIATIKAGQTWSAAFTYDNCGKNGGCNVGISLGQTLLAEWDHDGNNIWWNLSTDAGYLVKCSHVDSNHTYQNSY